jgi:O-glycosyl hydrolase
MYGQFSKFVRTDAVRIDSSSPGSPKSLEHVAFRNAANARGAGNAGAIVVVVVNTAFEDQELQLQCGARLSGVAKVGARSLATFRFHGTCEY